MQKQLALPTWWENFSAWWQIFKKLDDNRAPITKKTLYISLLITVGAALLNSVSLAGVLNALVSMVLSVSTSVTAAALLDLFFRMRADARFKWEQTVFRTLFNCDLDTPSVAIVIPRYYTSNEEMTDNVIERIVGEMPPADFSNWKIYKKAATLTKPYKDITISDVFSASFCDIVAATRLIAAFAENHLPIPDIIWDSEVENALNDDKYKTLIAIGLFSNSLTASVNELPELPQRMFRLEVGSKTDSDLYDFCRILLQEPNKPEELWKALIAKSRLSSSTVHGIVDVALFAKVPFRGKSVLICGGTTAEATQKLGNYIYRKWQDISLWQDNSKVSWPGKNILNQTVGKASWFALTFDIDAYKKDNTDNIVTDVANGEVRIIATEALPQ